MSSPPQKKLKMTSEETFWGIDMEVAIDVKDNDLTDVQLIISSNEKDQTLNVVETIPVDAVAKKKKKKKEPKILCQCNAHLELGSSISDIDISKHKHVSYIQEKEISVPKKIREYCDQIITPEINSLLIEFLGKIGKWNNALFHRDREFHKIKRRYYCGLKETFKKISLLKCIIMVPNVKSSPGILDDSVKNLLNGAAERKIPVMLGLNNRIIGKLCFKCVPINCVGIVDYSGLQDKFSSLMILVSEAKRQFAIDKLKALQASTVSDEEEKSLSDLRQPSLNEVEKDQKTIPVDTVAMRRKKKRQLKKLCLYNSYLETVSAISDFDISKLNHAPNVQKLGLSVLNEIPGYCDQLITPEINSLLTEFLGKLGNWDNALLLRDREFHKIRRRYFCGLKEILKEISGLKCIILVPNLKPTPGILDDTVENLMNASAERNIPVVFGLNKEKIAKLCFQSVPISCVGIADYAGLQDKFSSLMTLVSEAKRKFSVCKQKASLSSATTDEEEKSMSDHLKLPNLNEKVEKDNSEFTELQVALSGN